MERGRNPQLRSAARHPRRSRPRRSRIRPGRRGAAQPDVPAAPAGHHLRRIPDRLLAGLRCSGSSIGGVVAARGGAGGPRSSSSAHPACCWRCCSCWCATTPRSLCPSGPGGRAESWAPRGLLAELLRPRSAVASYFGGATQIVVMSALYAWLPSYFNRYLGLPAAQAAARTALVMAGRLHRPDRAVPTPPTASPAATAAGRLPLLAALSVMSMVLLVAAFAAMRPGNPQLLVILIAGFTHSHLPVRRGRLGLRGRGGTPRCEPPPYPWSRWRRTCSASPSARSWSAWCPTPTV